MRTALLLSSLLALATAVPVADPITIFNRATTPGTVYTKCSTAGTIALAYDDGPYTYTQKLVNTLNAAGAKATFFFTGTLYGEFPTPPHTFYHYPSSARSKTTSHLEPPNN